MLTTKLSLDSIQKTNYIELYEVGKSIDLKLGKEKIKISKMQDSPEVNIFKELQLRKIAYNNYSRN